MARGKKTKQQRHGLLRSGWVRTAAGFVFGALGSGHAIAQTPMTAAPAAPAAERAEMTRYHLNRQTIQLPIQLDEQFRPVLKEIRLFYKEKLSAPWTLRDTAAPTQT